MSFDLAIVTSAVAHAAVELPPEAQWLPYLVLVILGAAAAIDSFTSKVPDPLIFFGLLIAVGAEGFYVSWPFAAQHLGYALAAGIAVWVINQIWYRIFKRDAIGMGDAKWTMLAMTCFKVLPVLFAWGFGACLAVVWIGGAWLCKKRLSHVYFAPFLWAGLLVGIYWLR